MKNKFKLQRPQRRSKASLNIVQKEASEEDGLGGHVTDNRPMLDTLKIRSDIFMDGQAQRIKVDLSFLV